MKKPIDRSRLVTLIGVSAGLAAGCSPSTDGQWRVCTDPTGRRIADANCSTSSGGGAHGGGGWRYIDRSASAPAVGEEVAGGSRAPLAGTAYSAPAEGIARGGFGGTGDGGGEGGGHGGGAGE
ncbi:hypothetical protein ACLB0R_04205 [Sphingomonas sp. GlSt437]|uniref:hypothetical protein n=1 Tax=Sphingomonas sp. GlSt437 TaxID=3389970 RepID=UPI003A8953E0